MKIRNAIFTALISLFLMGPILLAVATDGIGIVLPDWFTSKESETFDGITKNEDILSTVTLDGFTEKTTQSALERQMSCFIPMKARARLLNASMQRGIIAASNVAFGYSCYPTYLDSNKIYIPAQNALSWTPWEQGESAYEAMSELGSQISAFAQRHPEKRIVVYVPGGLHTPAISPAFEYIPDGIDTSYVAELLSAQIGDATNFTVLADSYDSLDAYYENYWRTDHHWNALGATKAFNEIAAAWGEEPFVVEGVETIAGAPAFTGRTAPASLDMIAEEAFDITNDFSDLTIYSFDKSAVWNGNDHSFFWGMDETLRQYEFNAAWMLSQVTSRIEGPGTDNAVLISDSFGAALQRMIGQSHKTTYVPWSLFNDMSGDERLIDLIDDETRDIYIVADVSDFWNFLERYPHYFEG